MDTTSSYVKTINTPSYGRITLKGGYTYGLDGIIGCTINASRYISMYIRDATNNVQISNIVRLTN